MESPDAFYDSLEIRDPKERAREQGRALSRQIAHARGEAPAFAESLRDVDPDAITSREALATLPVMRKSDLIAKQQDTPPFGGLNATGLSELARVFASPGPIYEPQGRGGDFWRLARAFYAAGFRSGDLVHNSFSYHLTPGGWMLDNGARALGCPVFPAGVGNTEQQAQAVAHLRPAGFAGTPDYLKSILDKADELGLETGSLTKALVSGGPLFPKLRREYADRGVEVLQCYATADAGLIAYETLAAGRGANPGMVVDEGVILEIVRPGSNDPVPDGEVGEVVVTLLTPDYPLIRFSTGDLSAVLEDGSPCGRTNMRIKGWMGRADQTAKVKGMFVHPEQIAQVVERHPRISKARLVISRDGDQDAMTLQCEGPVGDEALMTQVAETLQSVCKMRGAVTVVEPGSLPNDGKVIDDQREV